MGFQLPPTLVSISVEEDGSCLIADSATFDYDCPALSRQCSCQRLHYQLPSNSRHNCASCRWNCVRRTRQQYWLSLSSTAHVLFREQYSTYPYRSKHNLVGVLRSPLCLERMDPFQFAVDSNSDDADPDHAC